MTVALTRSNYVL